MLPPSLGWAGMGGRNGTDIGPDWREVAGAASLKEVQRE